MIAALGFVLIQLTPFTADRVEIVKEGDASIINLVGRVVIEPESTRITCREAQLNETDGYIKLYNEIRIADPGGDISAGQAVYYLREKKAYLYDSVKLATENEIITSDTLFYDSRRRIVEMNGGVKIDDAENNLIAYGGRGWYNLADETGSLVERPRLELARPAKDSLAVKKEPMKVVAREFRLFGKRNMFWGYDSVQAEIDSIAVACDTFSYDLKTDRGIMLRPVVTQARNELTGVTGDFQLKEKNLDFFRVAQGSAQYFTRQGAVNFLQAGIIKIDFKDGNAVRITAIEDPRGKLQPKKADDADH